MNDLSQLSSYLFDVCGTGLPTVDPLNQRRKRKFHRSEEGNAQEGGIRVRLDMSGLFARFYNPLNLLQNGLSAGHFAIRIHIAGSHHFLNQQVNDFRVGQIGIQHVVADTSQFFGQCSLFLPDAGNSVAESPGHVLMVPGGQAEIPA